MTEIVRTRQPRFTTAALLGLITMASQVSSAAEPASAEFASRIRASHILVVGATGNNGGAIVKALDDVGAKPRLLVRDLARARERVAGEHDWILGDITKPETLGAALAGIDVVINAAATRDAEGPNNFEAVDLGGTRNLIAAAKQAKVRRIVFITGMTVGRPESEWPKPFVKGFGAKRDAEKLLIASGLQYAILRPTGILPRPANQWSIDLVAQDNYKVSLDEIRMRAPAGPAPDPNGPPPVGTISRADLAEVAIVAAVHPRARARVFVVTQGRVPASNDWTQLLRRMPGA
jgi:uncharacterized protein YbjT (DUF2867 family)